MGPDPLTEPDIASHHSHRDDVLNDVTIIQAQAQLMMRRIKAGSAVDHDDVYRRLAIVVAAAHRLAQLHR